MNGGAIFVVQYLVTGVMKPPGVSVLILTAVEGTGEAKDQCDSGFNIECQVGEHLHHQGLLDQLAPECVAVFGMMYRLGECLAHECCRRHRTIKACLRDHLVHRLDAVAQFTDQPPVGTLKFHLGGGV